MSLQLREVRQSKKSNERSLDENACGALLNAVEQAYRESESEWDEDRGTQFRTRLWDFTRKLKSAPAFAGFRAVEALHWVDAWLKQTTNFGDGWCESFDGVESAEDARTEFANTWDKIKFLEGTFAFERAFELACAEPFPIPSAPTALFATFVNFCFRLQALQAGLEFLLPVEKVGRLLGVSAKTVSSYRQMATRAGFIIRTAKGSAASHRADKFRVARLTDEARAALTSPSDSRLTRFGGDAA